MNFARAGRGGFLVWTLVALVGAIVLPPFYYLAKTSLTVERARTPTRFGLDNFWSVWTLGGVDLWSATLTYAIGSSALAIVLGTTTAWLVARTNARGRTAAIVGAFLSMSAPVIIKGIGWILLLGPNKGVVNEALRGAFGLTGVPITLFGLGGMIAIEAIIWTPVVFLLLLPTLGAMNPALEEAAAMCGARWPQIIRRVTAPLASPGILAVFLLTLIRSMESFEVPLLVGIPGRVETFTTAIYDTIRTGLRPRYGEASAFAMCLVLLAVAPLLLAHRLTRDGERFATIGGKSFRPARLDLGRWRVLAGVYLWLIPVSLVAPLLILLWASLLPIYEPPSLADLGRLSLANYRDLFAQPQTLAGLGNGVLVASLSATAVAALTFPLAWVVARRREPARWLIDGLASLPLVFPGIVLGTAVLIEFLDLRFIPIYGTIWIMVFAFLIRFMPYGLRFSHAAIAGLRRELEESARVCGASGLTVLRRVVLPLASPAVAAVWIYVFLYSIRDLSLPVILAGPRNPLIATVILDLWHDGKVPAVGAVSVVLATTATLLGWLFMRLARRHGAKGL